MIVQPNGRIKVLDFGVATRLWQPADTATTNSVIERDGIGGTLACMAPEILSGQTPDQRSDLWSLGVLLYRMASGEAPFTGRTAFDLTAAILHSPAPPLPSAVPLPLAAVIDRCLAKDRSDRYERATDVRAALEVAFAPEAQRAPPRARKKSSGAGSRRIRSLAVLPLDNLSRDPEQEYFADGMTEAIIADLAQIAALRVTSRTSAQRYKKDRPPLAEIVRALDVDAVIEGSVFLAGNRVRISAQLIHGASDTHLWASSYEGDLGDVLGLQRQVAQAIAHEIKVTVTPQERKRLGKPNQVDPDAHLAYLKGRYHLSRATGQDLQKAREAFELAIAKAPDYAPAHAALADAHLSLAVFGMATPRQSCPLALKAATRALELDPALSEGYRLLAFTKTSYEWDWSGADAAFEKALALSPGSALSHWSFSIALAARRRFDEALAHGHRAQAIDPLSLVVNNDLACVYWFARRRDEAIDHYRRTIDLDPHFVLSQRELGMVLAEQGRFDEAIGRLQAALPLSEDDEALTYLGITYAMAGRRDEANTVLSELRERARVRYVSPLNLAGLLGHVGARDEAFEWLERGYEERTGVFFLLQVYTILDPLRDDPRFAATLRRMKLA